MKLPLLSRSGEGEADKGQALGPVSVEREAAGVGAQWRRLREAFEKEGRGGHIRWAKGNLGVETAGCIPGRRRCKCTYMGTTEKAHSGALGAVHIVPTSRKRN